MELKTEESRDLPYDPPVAPEFKVFSTTPSLRVVSLVPLN
jgi:hypothetical protein